MAINPKIKRALEEEFEFFLNNGFPLTLNEFRVIRFRFLLEFYFEKILPSDRELSRMLGVSDGKLKSLLTSLSNSFNSLYMESLQITIENIFVKNNPLLIKDNNFTLVFSFPPMYSHLSIEQYLIENCDFKDSIFKVNKLTHTVCIDSDIHKSFLKKLKKSNG